MRQKFSHTRKGVYRKRAYPLDGVSGRPRGSNALGRNVVTISVGGKRERIRKSSCPECSGRTNLAGYTMDGTLYYCPICDSHHEVLDKEKGGKRVGTEKEYEIKAHWEGNRRVIDTIEKDKPRQYGVVYRLSTGETNAIFVPAKSQKDAFEKARSILEKENKLKSLDTWGWNKLIPEGKEVAEGTKMSEGKFLERFVPPPKPIRKTGSLRTFRVTSEEGWKGATRPYSKLIKSHSKREASDIAEKRYEMLNIVRVEEV